LSVLKSWDINLRQSEKKTLFLFFILYLFFVLLILLFISLTYYNLQKDLMLKDKRAYMSSLAKHQIEGLKYLHANFDKLRIYPRDKRYKSAIYDSTYVKIFSLLDNENVNLNEDIYLTGNKIHFIKEPESYYLGTKYVVIEIDDDGIWKKKTYRELFIYGTLFLIISLIIGYILMLLILRPMRDAISLLDRFIKDTTHELNTPVNTILSNIEITEDTKLDPKILKRLNRIKIGAKTISNLYQDLIYLTLDEKVVSKDEKIDLKNLLKERIEYFSLFFETKKISVNLDLNEGVYLFIDRKKITKLIDNLISNAIKYNRVRGTVEIVLREGYFYIKDTGRGIEKDKINTLFERYERVDKSVGGFGIGLSIVSKISKEYNLKVKIESQFKKWTKVSVSW